MSDVFMFEVGKIYETQEGDLVHVTGRTKIKGYECLICADGRHRYDRSNESRDAGRCTGTDHDYSCPKNFKRDPALVEGLQEREDTIRMEAKEMEQEMAEQAQGMDDLSECGDR